MKASIILPTIGTRHDYLTDALNTAKEQKFSKDDYEILVVDNSPESSLLPVIEKINRTNKKGPVIQWIKEPEIGLSKARNTGAQQANGEIVIYIGDDVLLNPDWLGAILEPFSDPKVGCSGGKLIPKWEAPIPEWFGQLKHMALGMLDYGNKTLVLKKQLVWGDNMALRRTVLLDLGGFHPDILGYGGNKKLIWFSGDGECGLERNIYSHGYKIIYEPRAWVLHRVPVSRTTKEYIYNRSYILSVSGSFSQIRKMQNTRLLPFRLLLQSGYYFLKSSVLFLKSWLARHNGIGTKTIAYHYCGMANHQLRAAFNRKLRNYIFQESYF